MRTAVLQRVARQKAVGLALATAVYVLVCVALVGTTNAAITGFSAIPAMLSGALFGLRTGVLYTLAIIAFNAAFVATLEPAARTIFFAGGVFGAGALVAIAALAGWMHDVGERLRRSDAQLRAVVDSSLSAIVGMDVDGRIIGWNRQAEALFGWTRDDALGRSVAETIVPPMLQPSHLRGLEDYRRTGEGRILGRRSHLQALHRSGRIFPVELTVTEVGGGEGGFSASIRDLSEVATQREELEHLAVHDALTGLANRAVLRERVELAAARNAGPAGYALLLLDLQNFERVNAAHGREAGDEVLRQVAERLRRLAAPDDTVARIGGDRFGHLVVGRPVSAEALTDHASALRSILDRPFSAGGIRFQLTGTIGVAYGPEHGADGKTMVRRAEAALDVARTLPERFAVFDQALEGRTADRRALIGDLRTALATNGLDVVYQPIVEIGSGRCSAVEALCRWDHAVRGPIPSETFIALAEGSGLIDSLDLWVLDAALEQSARWEADGFVVGVAVNIAPKHLDQGALARALAATIRSRALRSDHVTVEITESALGVDTAATVRASDAIRALGVRISIDDFGTGFSSFTLLQRLVIDQLKIDRSFVAQALSDEQSAAIVRTAIDLGHRLGARVVAEGVETVAQLEFLRRGGCDEAQGYLFSRPLPPDALATWLRGRGGGEVTVPALDPR